MTCLTLVAGLFVGFAMGGATGVWLATTGTSPPTRLPPSHPLVQKLERRREENARGRPDVTKLPRNAP